MTTLDLSNLSKEQAIAKAASYAGVGESVMSGLIHTESRGNPDAVSTAGATGAAQIMPKTQATWEARTGRTFNAHDFFDSLTMGALQLKENMEATKGNVVDALKMYNAGPDRSHWNNPETQAYAQLVLGGNALPGDDDLDAHAVSGHPDLDPESAWTTSARDLQSGLSYQSQKQAKPVLNEVEKGAVDLAGQTAAANAVVTGTDPATAAVDARVTTKPDVQNVVANEMAGVAAAPIASTDNSQEFANVQSMAQLEQNEVTKANAVTLQQKMGAFMDGPGMPTAAILDHFSRTVAPDQDVVDPSFVQHYIANADQLEAGHTQEEVGWLRDTTNEKQFNQVQLDIHRERLNARLENSNTTPLSRFGMTMAGGLLDPVSLVATAGIGKVAAVAGLGAREAFAAKQIGTGVLRAAGEGAAVNTSLTAITDAMGRHVSMGDYAQAAGTGALMGGGMSLLGIKGSMREGAEAKLKADADAQAASTAAYNKDLYTEASAQAGPNATADEISTAATNIEATRADAMRDHITSMSAADEDQIMPQVDQPTTVPKAAVQAQPAAPTTVLPKELQGAMPRYSFGDKQFDLSFESDVDKAAYIIAQEKPSKRDADYLQFVMQATGEDEQGARAYGKAVRSSIKSQAKESPVGKMAIESHFSPPVQAQVSAPHSLESLTDPNELVTVYRGESHENTPNGEWWTFDRNKAEKYGDVRTVTIRAGDLAKKAAQGHNGPDELVIPGGLSDQIANNGSGESSASLEAQSRLRDEKAAGQTRVLIEPNGTLRELHGVDAVDTFAREGQIIVQKGIGKKPWTIISHATGVDGDALAGKVNAVRSKLDSLVPEDDVEPVVGEHDLYEEQEPAQPESVSGPAADQRRETLLSGTPETDQLFPRTPVGEEPGPDLPNTAMLNTPNKIKELIDRHNIKSFTSDTTEQKMVAEVIARTERMVAEGNIDKGRLKPLLAKVGWEASSTRQLASDSVVLNGYAMKALENPEGASGRAATAAMVKYMREGHYVGNFLNDYHNQYKLYRSRAGRSSLREAWSPIAEREFDRKVYEELDRRYNNKERTIDPVVKEGADIVDRHMNEMRKDQKWVDTVGSRRLPDAEHFEGYFPRYFAAGKVGAFTPAERAAAVNAWSQEFQKTAGWDKKFSDDFAVTYLGRARTRALGGYDIPTGLHSTDAADMVRDSLAAMRIPADEIEKVMGKFSRGGASHTKGRIDADLTALYPDGNGGTMRLMDMMDTDIKGRLRSQARRVSGEVALARIGIMGSQGAKIVRLAAEATGATKKELESYDQTIAEFFGMPFGGAQSKIADNARSLTSALTMGGMGFTQLGDYGNALGHLGVLRVASAIKDIPRLHGEIMKMRKGQAVANSWLHSMEGAWGPSFGADGYRMHTMYDVNERYDMAGKENIGIFSKAIRTSAHINRVASGHRAIVAVQTRGMAEQIVQKAVKYMKDGGEDLALNDMGITKEIRDRLAPDLDKVVTWSHGHAVGFDLQKATDLPAAEAFLQAVHRGASQIVQETYIGETGKWAHNSLLKLLTQFRQFGLTSTQKQWRRQSYAFGTARALGYLLGAASFAIPIHMARVELKSIGKKNREKYLRENLSTAALGRATMNYVASLGILPDTLDIAGSAFQLTPYGSGPNTPKVLKALVPQGNGRGTSGGGLVSQIVPAVGTVDDAWKAVQSRKARDAIRLLPGGNLPYLQAALNQLDTK